MFFHIKTILKEDDVMLCIRFQSALDGINTLLILCELMTQFTSCCKCEVVRFLFFPSKLRYQKLLNRKSEASIRIKIVN